MTRTERTFMRTYDGNWRKRRGRKNIHTDQEILHALHTSKTQAEAADKLDVCRATMTKYIKQLKEKGLLQ